MDKITFFNEIKKATEFYHKPELSKVQLDVWYSKFKHCHDEDFKAAIDISLDKERYFPTPDILRKYVDEAKGYRARKQEPVNIFKPTKPASSSLVKDSVELITGAFQGKAGKGYTIAEAMKELDKRFPGIGFKENAEALIRELDADNFRHNAYTQAADDAF